MTLNAAIIMPPLQQQLWDKTLNVPLAGGVVSFFEDSNRTIPKNVYELTGTGPGSYTYTSLGSVINLSGIGTFVDESGANIAIYLWPFLGTPNDSIPSQVIQNYYITVYSSTGIFQFDIPNWPGITESPSPINTSDTTDNVISNPQFVDVTFNPQSPQTFTTGGTNTATEIAPDWSLITTGSGSFTVSQVTIVDPNAPGNPKNALQINTASYSNPVLLRQRIFTPRLFAGQYVSGTFIAMASGSSANLTMNYTPSITNVIQQICTGTVLTANFTRIFNTDPVLITNPGSGTGFVDITIVLPVGVQITISCIQLCGVADDIEVVDFLEQTPEREIDHLFHYFQPQLNFKPISSYLVGWDFPLNPSQFLGRAVGPFATGANTSNYVWDQTIIFQSVTNSFTISANPIFLNLVSQSTGQFALIQYLDKPTASSILIQAIVDQLSVNIRSGNSSLQTFTISLWWTTNTSLPDITANLSLVNSLDANGHPNSVAAGWNEILSISNQPVTFRSTTTGIADYGFTGWTNNSATLQNGNFFAIVIGTNNVATGQNIAFESISLVPGSIPTIPAPQTTNEVLRECRYYYNSSFLKGTVPAQGVGLNSGNAYGIQTIAGMNRNIAPIITYSTPMRKTPNVVLYNPVNANANIFNFTGSVDWSETTILNSTANGFVTQGVANLGSAVGDLCGVHWTSDARLGVV